MLVRLMLLFSLLSTVLSKWRYFHRNVCAHKELAEHFSIGSVLIFTIILLSNVRVVHEVIIFFDGQVNFSVVVVKVNGVSFDSRNKVDKMVVICAQSYGL